MPNFEKIRPIRAQKQAYKICSSLKSGEQVYLFFRDGNYLNCGVNPKEMIGVKNNYTPMKTRVFHWERGSFRERIQNV
jgi:hypothetical protein